MTKGFYKCPNCKAEFKSAEELNKHFNENSKCKAMAWMLKLKSGLFVRFAREG